MLGNAVRKTMLHFGLASLFVFAIVPLKAQSPVKPANVPVEIRYLGMMDNLPVFQIEFENTTSEVYVVSIKDGEGNILYTEKVKAKKFVKKFKWDRSDPDQSRLTFTLSSHKESHSQVFEINTNIRVVEDVVVTKL